MTQPHDTTDLIGGLLGPELGTLDVLDDAFSIFEEAAWKPSPDWDAQPMTRERFADQLFELGADNAHEIRAAMLQRFSSQVATRLGVGKTFSVEISDQTSYTFSPSGALLQLDYRTSLVGDNANQQLNAFIGLLVRGVGEHLMNEPGSRVREFMQSITTDFARFKLPELGDYAEQQAKIALTDRAISAAIQEEWPGFSKYALDGLYQLQSTASQALFVHHQKLLKDGKDDDGAPLSRDDRKRLELEMAGQYLQACTTSPGATYIDSGAYPWSMDIEQSGTMYRNVVDLETDHEFATKGNEIYGKVVERILDLTEEAPEPGEGDGPPDLSDLMNHHAGMAGAGTTAKSASAAKSALEQGGALGADLTVPWDKEKFQQLMEQEVEPCDERTPWAEGNPLISYFTLKTKPGEIAKRRYGLIKDNYRGQIGKLRRIIEDQFTETMQLERGLRSGRPDPARLVNIRFGKQEVFKRQEVDITGEPIDVVFLVDESGSMGAGVTASGYKRVESLVDRTAPRDYRAMAGGDADFNVYADDSQPTRAALARTMNVIFNAALHGLTGIRAWSLGYTTGDRDEYGLPASTLPGWEGDSMVRLLSTPGKPYGAALSVAHGGNGDKEALHEAIKLLEKESKGARKAIIYLADGGISDPTLESMLKNIQKEIPIFFVDLSNDVRGTGGSLKIDHHVPVNSIPDAVNALGRFFKDVVLA